MSLQYIDDKRFFLAGYGNGLIRLFDENGLENCRKILEFDPYYSHPELLQMIFNVDNTIATVGASSGVVRLWDLSAGRYMYE
jgi:WD40 repeat protein